MSDDAFVWEDMPPYSGPAPADDKPWYAQTLETLINAAASSRYRTPTMVTGQLYQTDQYGRLVAAGQPVGMAAGAYPMSSGGVPSWLLLVGAAVVVVLLVRG